MKHLSFEKRKEQILPYIREYQDEHGYSPSLAEIAEFLSMSREGVNYILKKMVKDGTIRKTQESKRNIELLV